MAPGSGGRYDPVESRELVVGPYSIVHLALLIGIAALVIVPVYRLLREGGYPPALALLALFLPFGVLMLCWLAWDARHTRDGEADDPR